MTQKEWWDMLQTMNVATPPETKLKLFTCRVIYTDPQARNTWFTVLDISKDAAHETCQNRVSKFRSLKGRRGRVSIIHVTEIEGPFMPGQILHEER